MSNEQDSTHTPGKLRMDGAWLVNEGENDAICVFEHAELGRRLVACHNALIDLPTDLIEMIASFPNEVSRIGVIGCALMSIAEEIEADFESDDDRAEFISKYEPLADAINKRCKEVAAEILESRRLADAAHPRPAGDAASVPASNTLQL